MRTVDHHFALVNCTESQKVAYSILLLAGNARCWWDAEYVARGSQRPESAEEFKKLLSLSGISVVKAWAVVELLHLHSWRKQGRMPA